MSATSPHGLFSMLDGTSVDEVYALVGPFIVDLAEYLAEALPNTYIITSLEYNGNRPNVYAVTIGEAQVFKPPTQIYILGTKGGVGKSTLAYLLAFWLDQSQHNQSDGVVLLVDADTQAGLSLMVEVSISGNKPEEDTQITGLQTARLWKHPRANNLYVLLNQYGNTKVVPPYLIGGIMGGGWTIVDCGNDPNVVPPLDAYVVLLCEPGIEGLEGVNRVMDRLGGKHRVTVVMTPVGIPTAQISKYQTQMNDRLQEMLGGVVQGVEVLPLIFKNPWKPSLAQLETFLDRDMRMLMQRIINRASASTV